MRVLTIEMDHFVPWKSKPAMKGKQLAYEWSNFRAAEASINQRKYNHRVFDPFRVSDEWFEILLPSLQLVLTERVPIRHRSLLEKTLELLQLGNGEVIVRYRASWFTLYRQCHLSLEGLRDCAPLIANAVERDLRNGINWQFR
jgi:hypothetical protein